MRDVHALAADDRIVFDKFHISLNLNQAVDPASFARAAAQSFAELNGR